ncbi:MAG: adenylosuccinate synthetase [Spirochaetaceae bacterium]
MNVVVIGAQWGDEGKGKIVDFLASGADVVVRFSGGANAGHTIVRGRNTYKLHLIPSGILYENTRVVLGSAMVIDPEALQKELATISDQGVLWSGRVLVSDRAHIVLPRHRDEDREMDKQRDQPIGTTGRGIGTTYAAKARRDGVRVADVLDPQTFARLGKDDRTFLEPYREFFAAAAVNVHEFIHGHAGEHVLLEGAQGALLDIDLGTYPYVSSGISAAAGACPGAGLGPKELDRIVGVCKAYTTRVGNGPFPTEFRAGLDEELGEQIREIGNEYGVTTGRPRRCGYLDLVALRYTCRANSIDSLALTHLDVYDSFDEVKACVGYRLDGVISTEFPASISALERAEPVVETFPGWKEAIDEVSDFDALPGAARDYMAFIEEYTGSRVDIVSVGSERRQTIVRRDPWS